MNANIFRIGDPLLDFLFAQASTISISLLLMLFTGWITTKFLQYNNRLIKVENDTSELKTDMKVVKKRLTRIEGKLDKLISYLITTKQVDKDALG